MEIIISAVLTGNSIKRNVSWRDLEVFWYKPLTDKCSVNHYWKKFIDFFHWCHTQLQWCMSFFWAVVLSTSITYCCTHRSMLNTAEVVWLHIQSFIIIKAQPPSVTFTTKVSGGKRNNSPWNEEDNIDLQRYLSQCVASGTVLSMPHWFI